MRKLSRAVLATLVVAVSCLAWSFGPGAQRASAAVPLWAVDAADEIKGGCDRLGGVAESMMGAGTGNLAFLAPPALAPATLPLAGTGAGTAAAGTAVTASASTIGLAALTFVGVGCATIKLGDFLFPAQEPVPQIALSDISVAPMRPCSEIPVSYPGAAAGDYCMVVSVARSTALTDVYLMPRQLRQDKATGTVEVLAQWLPERLTTGTAVGVGNCAFAWSSCNRTAAQMRPYNSATGTATYVFPCFNPELLCGLTDFTTESISKQRFPGFDLRRAATGSANVVATFPMDPGLAERGQPYRMRGVVQCKRPLDGNVITVDESSPPWFGADGGIENWAGVRCPDGYAPIDVDLRRQKATGGMTAPATWANDGGATIDWTINPSVRDNPTSLQCWVVGVTSCPIWIPEGDPEAPTRIGGPDGVPQPRTAPTVGTQTIPQLLDEAPWPAEEPSTPPTTVPTTTPTTVPVTTIPTTPTTIPGTPPGGPGSPGTPPESSTGDESECLPDGWGWLNPIEWVLKPVKCALVWAFYDADAAAEMGELWGDTADPWVDTVSETAGSVEFSAAAGPCIDMQYSEICTSAWLDAPLPTVATALFTALIVFCTVFEVVGLFSRITGG